MPWFSISGSEVNLLKISGLLIILFVVWRVGLVFERAISRIGSEHGKEASPGWYALSRIGRYIVWIVGSAIGLGYLGFNVGSFAVLGGAIGVGVGFGLQNIINNFVSGIIILIEKTIKVDDFVELQSGTMGKVIEINLRYTRITTTDLIDIVVPNSEFISGRVVNWTMGERLRRLHVPFGVAYGSDKDLVKEAGIAAAHSVPDTVTDPNRAPDVWLVKFGDSSLDFELIVWVGEGSVSAPGRTNARYMWAIETELAKRNLEIPFPQRDLHVRSGTLSVSLNQPA
ncbi:MAG: mechanosensitive ion channel family protein [Pseudomonadota bacterium]